MFSGCPSVRLYVRTYVCTYVRPVLVIALSEEPIDGFLPNFGHVCILQSR